MPSYRRAKELPSALQCRSELADRLRGKRVVVFLDYDGTLTPIVSRPEDALLSDDMRATLKRLAERYTVAVVSGRDRAVVQDFVKLDGLVYAGSHGFDIAGPGGLKMEHDAGAAAVPDLDEAERLLRDRLEPIPGAQVERKRFSVAAHYRNVPDEFVDRVEKIVNEVDRLYGRLRRRDGKKVFELRPDVDWDKGKAVFWLLEALAPDSPDALPMYLGDDLTDEDAFEALAGRGIGILVGDHEQATAADYGLADVGEAQDFLSYLIDLADKRPG